MYAQVIDDILDVTQTTEQLGKTAAKDVAADKTTYPKLLGIEKSRQIADDLIKEAIAQLDEFEPARRAPLVALAKFIGYRQVCLIRHAHHARTPTTGSCIQLPHVQTLCAMVCSSVHCALYGRASPHGHAWYPTCAMV